MVVGDARRAQRLARAPRGRGRPASASHVRWAYASGVARARRRRAMSDEPGGDVGVPQLAAITGLSRVVRGDVIARGRRRDDGGEQALRRPRHSRRRSARVDVHSASQPPPSVVGEKRRRSSSAARGSPAKARLGSGGGDQQRRSVLSFFQKGQVDRAEAPEDRPLPPSPPARPKVGRPRR